MRAALLSALFWLGGWAAVAAGRPWQTLVSPTVDVTAKGFQNPPPEYGMVLWWFWNGPMTEADIRRNLDDMSAQGVRSFMLWAYNGIGIEYLSPTWFARVRFAVDEARKRNMRVWLADEGSYPSGFVGGRITRDYPSLRMQVIEAVSVGKARGGETFSWEVSPTALAHYAVGGGISRELTPREGRIRWTPPEGEWNVLEVRHTYRTSATRYIHTPGFRKDGSQSLYDPLDPTGTRVFLKEVHERYKQAVGREFGRTIMGFMGDEPSVAGLPWSPRLFDEFQQRKGYDLREHLLSLVRPETSRASALVNADFVDVWSELYSDHFFGQQAEWCGREGLEYIVHLCGEEDLKTLVKLNGDYFRCNRKVQTPGVDAIWRQIWPGVVADYPKLASSSAHLRGRPRAFTESYAVYGTGTSLEQAKWVMDQQFVRGINHFQAMEFLSSASEFRPYFHPPDWHSSPLWPYFGELARYANRLSYVLSVGRPAARVAVYYPTTSGWLRDFDANTTALEVARRLLETQRDFDFIDDEGLEQQVTVERGGLRNRSGQVYGSVVVPKALAMRRGAMEQLDRLEQAGGTVLYIDRFPSIIAGRSYLNHQTAPEAGRRVVGLEEALRRLPESDVRATPATPQLKVLHRQLSDGEVYFWFNEGAAAVDVEAEMAGAGTAQQWDPRTGEISGVTSGAGNRGVRARLRIEPYGTRLIVIGKGLNHAAPRPDAAWTTLVEIGGEWDLAMGGRSVRTPLRSWADLGSAGFSGTAVYETTFEANGKRGRISLDLGTVKYAARVTLNGVDLGRRAWGPFRWDVSGRLRPGQNRLRIEVANTQANELLGDPAQYREIEAKGWLKGSYVGMYGKFDREMISSGLMGPVRMLEEGTR